eukprot:Colp12_sorted_trinity150504_noHs@34255
MAKGSLFCIFVGVCILSCGLAADVPKPTGVKYVLTELDNLGCDTCSRHLLTVAWTAAANVAGYEVCITEQTWAPASGAPIRTTCRTVKGTSYCGQRFTIAPFGTAGEMFISATVASIDANGKKSDAVTASAKAAGSGAAIRGLVCYTSLPATARTYWDTTIAAKDDKALELAVDNFFTLWTNNGCTKPLVNYMYDSSVDILQHWYKIKAADVVKEIQNLASTKAKVCV